MSRPKRSELHSASYELFILALSVLSLGNVLLLLLPLSSEIKQIVLIVDVGLTVVFLSDFSLQLFSAPSNGSTSSAAGGGWTCWEACPRCGSSGCSG